MRRKYTFRAHGRQVVLIKRDPERVEHVLMKALIWALYLPLYPALQIEVRVGDRYTPDVVQRDPNGSPIFWGEAGQVGVEKIQSLVRRYPTTHFALGKWSTRLAPYQALVEKALGKVRRQAPFDLICFPADSVDRFFDDEGQITITHADLEWLRLEP